MAQARNAPGSSRPDRSAGCRRTPAALSQKGTSFTPGNWSSAAKLAGEIGQTGCRVRAGGPFRLPFAAAGWPAQELADEVAAGLPLHERRLIQIDGHEHHLAQTVRRVHHQRQVGPVIVRRASITPRMLAKRATAIGAHRRGAAAALLHFCVLPTRRSAMWKRSPPTSPAQTRPARRREPPPMLASRR